MNSSNNKLIEKIEKTRENMIVAGLKLGFTHQETVLLSTQLDHLLNELHNREISFLPLLDFCGYVSINDASLATRSR